MVRLALCAVGLALAAPSVRAGHRRAPLADQTGLLQMGIGSLEAEKALVAESGGKTKHKSDAGYAFEEYKEGMLVETKMNNGTWVLAAIQSLKPGNVWDIKIPGQDLQGVPAGLLRRRLDEGESDWLVVNRFPGNAARPGVPYFGSKNMKDSLDYLPYASFNSFVVGKDEVDGWLKVSCGYLPMTVKGWQVLAKRERKQTPALTQELRDWYLETEEARRKDLLAKASLEPPPPQHYEVNEEALFQTSDGAWSPARVISIDFTTYSVLVQPVGGTEYKVSKVLPSQLRKAGPPKHTPVEGESPDCANQGGCIDVRLKVASAGNEFQYYYVRAAMGMTLHGLRKSACEAMQNGPVQDLRHCYTRIELSLHGAALPPSWRTFETGIKDHGTVDVKLGPVSVTDVVEEYQDDTAADARTGLSQIRSSAEASFDVEASGGLPTVAEESGDKPKPVPGYTPEDYKEGMLVEVQLPNGTWVAGAIQRPQPGDVWDVKMPGQTLQGVPARSMRRRLDEGESDWLVLETAARRAGLKYRHSKNLTDVNSTGFVLSNSFVICRGEADGWVQTRHGYLPINLLGEKVLAKRDRTGTVEISDDFRDWYIESEDARRRAAMAKKAGVKPLPPVQTYAVDEGALFQAHDGAWSPAKVVSSAANSTYSVTVRPAGAPEYTVHNIHAQQLRKAGPPKHEHVEGESPMCQNEGGCIEVQVTLEPVCQDNGGCTEGAELTVHTAMGRTIGGLVEAACKEIHSPYSCDTRLELRQHGKALANWWRIFEAGLKDGAAVSATLAPATLTPVTEV